MNSTGKVLLLLSLAMSLAGQCSLGCIACEKLENLDFNCQVCDLHNQYSRNEKGKCEKVQIPDCELASADHTKKLCLSCKLGFYLNTELEKCVQIPASSLIPKCEKYSSLNHCSQCERDNYIKDGVCIQVGTVISGCMRYSGDGTACEACEALKHLKDGKCEAFPARDNCLNYSEIVCDECATGFLKERNYHSSLELTASIVHSVILDNSLTMGLVLPPPATICHKKTIDKCTKYLNFSQCEDCEQGYFVDKERGCRRNPYNKIQHCGRYSDHLTCAECETSHFLASNSCVARTLVLNCLKYDRFSSTCVECLASHFLAGNSCVLRAFSRRIDRCTQNNLQADECLVCKQRFRLTDDKKACLLAIDNCQTYLPNSRYSMSSLICQTCRPGFYRESNGTQCSQQDVVNCKVYNANSPTCSDCDPGFYLNSPTNECKPYTKTECKEFAANSDTCKVCVAPFYESNGSCVLVSLLNCKEVEASSRTCKTCEDDHFKVAGDENCYQNNLIGCGTPTNAGNKCAKCISGYFMKDELCWKNNLPNCVQTAADRNECVNCEEGFFPDSNKYCRPYSIPNCRVFEPNQNKCASGGCSPGYINSGKFCTVPNSPNCQTLTPNSNQCAVGGCLEGFVRDASGYCRKQAVPFCKRHTANANQCDECEKGYYNASSKCFPQIMRGCISFSNLTSLDCAKCAEGYFLTSNRCYPYTISNCKVPLPTVDACTDNQCQTGFVKNQTTGNCQIMDLPFCKSLDLSTFPVTCNTCHIGYVLDSGQCLVSSEIPNCIEPSNVPGECVLCGDGYYLHSDKTCKKQSGLHSDNCLVFKPNSSDCLECKSLFHGNNCGAITTTAGCLFSNGVHNPCQMCKRGFKNLASCSAVTLTDPDLLDANCLGNVSTDDTTCSLCKPGLELIGSFAENVFKIENCLKLNSGNTKCDQCKEGFMLTTAGKCASPGAGAQLCLQKVAGDTSDLTNKASCAKCPNLTTFKQTTNCEARTVFYDDCEEYLSDSNTESSTLCIRCKAGKAMTQAVSFGYCVKRWNPAAAPTTPTLANCKVFSLNDIITGTPKCVVCDTTRILKSDNTACEMVSTSPAKKLLGKGVTDDLEFGAVQSVLAEFVNVNTGSFKQVSRGGELMFTLCFDNNVRRIGLGENADANGGFEFTAGVIKRPNYLVWTKDIGPFNHGTAVDSCLIISTLSKIPKFADEIREATKVDVASKDSYYNCENVVDISGQGQTCIKCKQGFNGFMVKPTHMQDGTTTITNPVVGLDCAATTTLFEKRYEGLSALAATTEKFILDDFLQYDSCENGGTLVVFMEIVANQYFWSKSLPSGFQRSSSMRCVDSVPEKVRVPNCHVYILKADQDPASSIDASYKCVACKPGFKASVTANAATRCSPIANCDTSDASKNTWLNLCQTCNSNASWGTDATNKHPLFDACYQTATANCQLLDDNATVSSKKCLMCHDGYHLTAENLCLQSDLTNSNCATAGREANAFMHKMSEAGVSVLKAANNERFFMAMVSFLLWKYDKRFAENMYGCEACESGYTLVSQIELNPIKACVAQWPVFVRSVGNCKSYKGSYSVGANALAKCRECESGFHLVSTEDSCVQNNEASQGCQAKDGSGKCTSCESDYVLYNTSGTPMCHPNRDCIEWSGASLTTSSIVCSVCKAGYRPVSASSSQCEEIPPTDPCSEYGKFNKCVKCKNGGHPIHYTGGIYTGPIIVCTGKKHSNAFFSISSFELDDSGLRLLDTSAVSLEYFKLGTTATDFFTAANPRHVCLPGVKVRNCVEYGGLVCRDCKEGYVLIDPFYCAEGTLANCLKYSSVDRCRRCEPGFVVSSTGTCVTRTGVNCLEYDLFQDVCRRCQEGFYLSNSESSNKRCLPRTNLMCKSFADKQDVCYECHEGYYLDLTPHGSSSSSNTGSCIKKDHPGCLYSLVESNDCRICGEGFYLSSEGSCQKYSFVGCDIWSPVEDKCLLCKEQFYKDTTTKKCHLRKNLNCLQFMYYQDNCLSCKEGHYRTCEKCVEYSVTGCSIPNPYADRCEACEEGLYLDAAGKCVPSDDINCELKSDYLSGCLKCRSSTYLHKTTQKCTDYTVNCEHYNPYSDECLSCPETRFFSSGKCLRYSAKNCGSFSLFEDRCLSCKPGHYFEEDKCLPIIVKNCDVPNYRKNACVICSRGYFNNQGLCQVYTLSDCRVRNPSKNECYRCELGFYLDPNNLCKPYTKTNCFGFLPNSDRCISCEGDFFMDDGDCKPYTKTNCILRDAFADSCFSCDEGHFLSGNQCLAYTVGNCKTRDPNADHCLSCFEGYYLEGFWCKKYTAQNCKTYSPFADLCLECEGHGIFRNGLGLCQKSKPVSWCKTHNKYFDRCDECDEGHFLENAACVPNPSGVSRCMEYLDESICRRCESPYYLRDNVCIISGVIIDNCDFYSHEAICVQCQPGHILLGSKCHMQTNLTCLEWSSPENCSKCAEGRLINSVGSTMICQDIGINQCAEATFNPTGQHTCDKCKSGHYLKDNACLATSAVANCRDYSTDLLCSRCMPNHILSLDKKTCAANVAIAGANCGLAHFNDTPLCSVCTTGFVFDADGACVPCQVSGCAICDVINSRKCKLCLPGFQMTELFYCVSIELVQGGSLGNINNRHVEDHPKATEEGAPLLQAFGLTFAAWAFFISF